MHGLRGGAASSMPFTMCATTETAALILDWVAGNAASPIHESQPSHPMHDSKPSHPIHDSKLSKRQKIPMQRSWLLRKTWAQGAQHSDCQFELLIPDKLQFNKRGVERVWIGERHRLVLTKLQAYKGPIAAQASQPLTYPSLHPPMSLHWAILFVRHTTVKRHHTIPRHTTSRACSPHRHTRMHEHTHPTHLTLAPASTHYTPLQVHAHPTSTLLNVCAHQRGTPLDVRAHHSVLRNNGN
eukprot:scaffold242431_cov27-Tisochrysis_lutea.AAC.1